MLFKQHTFRVLFVGFFLVLINTKVHKFIEIFVSQMIKLSLLMQTGISHLLDGVVPVFICARYHCLVSFSMYIHTRQATHTVSSNITVFASNLLYITTIT
jgi:hypothetical protein